MRGRGRGWRKRDEVMEEGSERCDTDCFEDELRVHEPRNVDSLKELEK